MERGTPGSIPHHSHRKIGPIRIRRWTPRMRAPHSRQKWLRSACRWSSPDPLGQGFAKKCRRSLSRGRRGLRASSAMQSRSMGAAGCGPRFRRRPAEWESANGVDVATTLFSRQMPPQPRIRNRGSRKPWATACSGGCRTRISRGCLDPCAGCRIHRGHSRPLAGDRIPGCSTQRSKRSQLGMNSSAPHKAPGTPS